MKLNANEIYSFKLASGEELIAKYISTEDNFIVVEEPVSIAPGPKGIGLMPSMFTAEAGAHVRLNTNTVTLYSPTEDGVRMKYLEATTGIQVPEKKLILG